MLSAPRLSLAIGAMAGILFAFLAWSNVWALAGQRESSYGLTQTTSFSVIGGDNATVPAAARSLTNILKSNDATAVIDPQGNGAPGLSVIDPSGRIPWLPQESSIVGQAGTLWLFEVRYCADEDRTGLRCPLLPPEGTVAGKIPPPPQAGQSLQFAVVLTAETPLPAGRYIVTGLPSAARDSFQEALESTGLRVVSARSVPAPVEILTNPTVIVAMGLLGAGLVAVWVYGLREGARHRADMQVHDGAGATARRLVTRQLRATAVVMLPAMGLGGSDPPSWCGASVVLPCPPGPQAYCCSRGRSAHYPCLP